MGWSHGADGCAICLSASRVDTMPVGVGNAGKCLEFTRMCSRAVTVSSVLRGDVVVTRVCLRQAHR